MISEFNSCYAGKKIPELKGQNFNEAARKSFWEMWNGKSFICPETELILSVLKRTDGLYEVRNIPILYQTGKNAYGDDIVIIFDAQAQIHGILIALEKDKYIKMFEDSKSLQDRRMREIILNFLENFRTAYNRKDSCYLEQVFSDNALIIVGRVLSTNQKKIDQLDLPTLSDGKKVEYVKLSKAEYISNLRKVFQKNKFVKVDFADFKIQHHPVHQDFYGVQLKQKWQSSSYSDEGYLFLLIDMKNEDEPVIWVRTWQPSEQIKPEEAFDMADFSLN